MRSLIGIFGLCLISFLATARTPATVDTAVLFGVVTDEAMVPVPGTIVRVRNNLTQTTLVVRANAQGEYVARDLRQGRYSVRAEAKDHEQLWICEVVVQSGERLRRDLVLRSTNPGHVLPEPVCPDRLVRSR